MARTRPFEERLCRCVKAHSPKPLVVEEHHLYPQSLQRRRHGKLVDRQTVTLCSSGHRNVHKALDPFAEGGELGELRNRYLQGVVEEGARRIGEVAA